VLLSSTKFLEGGLDINFKCTLHPRCPSPGVPDTWCHESCSTQHAGASTTVFCIAEILQIWWDFPKAKLSDLCSC